VNAVPLFRTGSCSNRMPLGGAAGGLRAIWLSSFCNIASPGARARAFRGPTGRLRSRNQI